MVEIIVGDCIESLRAMPAQSVNCCITSPPYFGLRDYGHDGQIGLEQTPDEFVAKLVEVFREVRRVLRDDGTLWLNLGDTYAANRGGTTPPAQTVAGGVGGKGGQKERRGQADGYNPTRDCTRYGLKHKDLIGIPWRVAFALQADGWYLRQDIIWHKPNPMPESVRDRCTKAHEYVFLLSKSERYHFDAEAIKEPVVCDRKPGQKVNTTEHYGAKNGGNSGLTGLLQRYHNGDAPTHRNRRSVWTVTTKPFKGAHFATFPPDLIEPCVLAGCPAGGVVLDPFGGAGTTGLVAQRHGRRAILCELNPEYAEMARARIDAETAPPKAKRATRQRVQQADLFGEVRA
jgi:site-specific DNA-methyltransferase (adenine-specific)